MKNYIKVISLFIVTVLCALSFACNAESGKILPSEHETITYEVTPLCGDTVKLHTEKQSAFLSGAKSGTDANPSNDYLVSTYANGTEELSRPLPVVLTWSGEDGVNSYFVELSVKENFSNAKTYLVNGKTISVYNLYSGTEYFWRVAPTLSEIVYSSVYNFTTEEGVRNVFIDGISNVRDLGGYYTDDGAKVKQGLIYRGGRWNTTWSQTLELNFKGDGLKTVINDLAIKTEIDLRGEADGERGQMNDSVIPEVKYLLYGCSWSAGMYPANRDTLRRIFEEVLSDESKYPIYFHCNIGTDRTGMVAYLLNGLLGVSEKDLQIDYLLSNFGYIGGARSLSGDMNEYVSVIASKSGNTYKSKVEDFLINEVGVSAAAISRIRNILLAA